MLRVSSIRLILIVSLFITLVDNQTFFTKISERLDIFSLQGGGYLLTVYAIIFLVLVFIQLVFGFKFLLKPIMVVLLVSSAILSYFSQQLGIIFDVDMVRNIVETIKDNNQHEAFELISPPLIKHVLLYGGIPVLLVLMSKIVYKSFLKEVVWRVITGLVLIAIIGALISLNFKYVTFFSRENRDLRVYITPLYAIDSIKGFVRHELDKNKAPLKILGDDAIQIKQGVNRRVGLMVVGETARWDHFSLNGYDRKTNPKLENTEIINYSQTTSCGTSTAYSVPCMFSFLDKDNYSPGKASRQTNVLDVLSKTGVKVYWIDNNSSCKGVCERIGQIDIRNNPDPNSPFYTKGELFDEELVTQVDKVLSEDDGNSDILIVLHTLGSHGPKYYRRYPDKFSQFEPACKKSTPQECTDKEIINAYDNTILYTDHVISQLIDYLQTKQAKNDTFLIYASDHGESLGEKGVYLHGLPYFLAPEAQTHVPMLTWFSENYIKNEKLDIAKMKTLQVKDVSHDFLSHTMLSVFEVNTSLYKKDHDLLSKK